jgi:ribosomal protein L11
MEANKDRTVRAKVNRFGNIYGGILAPKIGPLGVSPRVVIEKLKELNQHNMHKHIVELTVHDSKTVSYTPIIETSDDIIGCINHNATSTIIRQNRHYHNVTHEGTISLNHVIRIAAERFKSKQVNAKSLTAAVMSVLGTCSAIGCKVNSMNPQIIQSRIASGDLVVEDYLDDSLYDHRYAD